MPIKNVTRNSIIASSSKIADSIMGRAVGLMFSRPTQKAMVLRFPRETVISLHTFFVFFPIDVILLDGNMRVVEVLKRMQPFTTYSAGRKARLVVEVPAGTIAKSRTRPGDRIAVLRIVEKKLSNGKQITVCKA
ncbi:DUF192 domain-containing protein [Candidatus Woesearchaeota archaeon]|nr:DUF192 domain-containing protein [Candidatus Woesearchaeota archaeon]